MHNTHIYGYMITNYDPKVVLHNMCVYF